ncbi:hypothetical protein ACN42_g127 [Penicillium freii]|uniref:Uncharacterized protein n=1 Tax=Penicillium freii TaxID=48697 RepID=A0A124GTR0_PENFR|nr:hypothetical protein ACN42_g127 [Penicillium freii]
MGRVPSTRCLALGSNPVDRPLISALTRTRAVVHATPAQKIPPATKTSRCDQNSQVQGPETCSSVLQCAQVFAVLCVGLSVNVFQPDLLSRSANRKANLAG